MAKLTGPEIISRWESGDIIIDPLDRKNVGPNSVDLTLGDNLMVYKYADIDDVCMLDMKKPPETIEHKIPKEGFVLHPNTLYLGVTRERAGSDFYVACIEGRSSVARLGLQVHMTAGFGDLGFKGCWTLEMVCTHSIRIYAGTKICQVYFDTVVGDIGDRYDKEHRGKYGKQDEVAPVASRLYKDFE